MAFLIIFICVIVLLLVVCLAIAAYLFNLVCVRKQKYISVPIGSKKLIDDLRQKIKAGIEWFLSQPYENISILSHDGLVLRGKYLPYQDSQKTAVCVHGYTSNGLRDFGRILKVLHDGRFNVLVFDQRAAGDSEGKYITFGIKERHDCLLWIKTILEKYGEKDIYIFGVSMGATTSLMTLAADELPENIKGVVSDCAYLSPYHVLKYQLERVYKIPPFPVLWFVAIICKLKAGFFIKELTTLEAISKTDVPIFFAHGQNDIFVPPEMTRKSYETCASRKTLFIVAGAKHFTSFDTDTEAYIKKVKEFFEF